MFHVSKNLFFGRKANGDVRILKFPDDYKTAAVPWPDADYDGKYPDAVLDIAVKEDGWCSAVASVSRSGETAVSYCDACELHSGKDSDQIKSGGLSNGN